MIIILKTELKYEMHPVIQRHELKLALEEEFGEDFSELVNLFWDYSEYCNDSLKSLRFKSWDDPTQLEVEDYNDYTPEEEIDKRNKVYAFLFENIPSQFDSVLIDVSW